MSTEDLAVLDRSTKQMNEARAVMKEAERVLLEQRERIETLETAITIALAAIKSGRVGHGVNILRKAKLGVWSAPVTPERAAEICREVVEGA